MSFETNSLNNQYIQASETGRLPNTLSQIHEHSYRSRFDYQYRRSLEGVLYLDDPNKLSCSDLFSKRHQLGLRKASESSRDHPFGNSQLYHDFYAADRTNSVFRSVINHNQSMGSIMQLTQPQRQMSMQSDNFDHNIVCKSLERQQSESEANKQLFLGERRRKIHNSIIQIPIRRLSPVERESQASNLSNHSLKNPRGRDIEVVTLNQEPLNISSDKSSPKKPLKNLRIVKPIHKVLPGCSSAKTKNLLRNFANYCHQYILHNARARDALDKMIQKNIVRLGAQLRTSASEEIVDVRNRFDRFIRNKKMENFQQYKSEWQDPSLFGSFYRFLTMKFYLQESVCYFYHSKLTNKDTHIEYLHQFLRGLSCPKKFTRFRRNSSTEEL